MIQESPKVRIALLGCGVVGGGVIRLIQENARHLAARVGAELQIAHVLVRDTNKARVPECLSEWVTTDSSAVLSDPTVDLVVEVIGGEEPAHDYIKRALSAGKSVVSANKLLLAKHGPELVALATRHKADLAFEASVGGGVPIIRTLRDALTSDWVSSVHALLNGTCNYILTRMQQEGLGFADILKDAQELGYAEAEPSLDVDGHDAVQKLVVLSMLAFEADVDDASVHVEGIRAIDALDFRFAARFNFAVKHVAVGIDRGKQLELRVHPALVPKASPLANINGVLNGALIHGRALGPCLLVGPGAGEMPTAVSVVADIVDVARARVAGASGLNTGAISVSQRALYPLSDLTSRYYLRFDVRDEVGVLGLIATTLGKRAISVEHMVQEGKANETSVLMITHRCNEGDVQQALKELASAKFMNSAPRLIRVEDI